MAAEAGFGRDIPEPMSVEHDGYDTNPKTPNYQMIPPGGSRIWSARTRGRVAITVVHPSLARISLASFPGAPTPDQVLVFDDAMHTLRDIRITAASGPTTTGRTQVVALDMDNNLRELAQITISVKPEARLTYNLLRLRDLRRPPARERGDLENIASLVERVYLKQTNTRLVRQESKEIFVKLDLGDPIRIEGDSSAAAHKLLAAVKKMIIEGQISKAGRQILSTWDLDDYSTQGWTPAFGSICMVEALANGLLEVKTMAHELGHTFKLEHIWHDTSDLLMHDRPEGMRMIGPDIDRINQAGT